MLGLLCLPIQLPLVSCGLLHGSGPLLDSISLWSLVVTFAELAMIHLADCQLRRQVVRLLSRTMDLIHWLSLLCVLTLDSDAPHNLQLLEQWKKPRQSQERGRSAKWTFSYSLECSNPSFLLRGLKSALSPTANAVGRHQGFKVLFVPLFWHTAQGSCGARVSSFMKNTVASWLWLPAGCNRVSSPLSVTPCRMVTIIEVPTPSSSLGV